MPLYRSGLGCGGNWKEALDQALVAVPRPGSAIGLLYVDERFADALDLIVHDLVRRTGVTSWFGTVSTGVFASNADGVVGCDLAILFPPWDGRPLRIVGGGHAPDEPIAAEGSFALVHGDRRLRRALPLRESRIAGSAFAVGGITAARNVPMILGRPAEDELGALVLDPSLEPVAGISQACAPIGPVHQVDAADGAWLRRLDNRPAYSILEDEVGEILSRQPGRITGYIHVEIESGDGGQGQVRPILSVESKGGGIAIAEPLRRGQRLRFVKRDAEAARISFAGMLGRLRAELGGRPPSAALYIASRTRLTSLFEDPVSEVRLVEESFGVIPLVGFCSDGEVFASRLHDWSSILVLFR